MNKSKVFILGIICIAVIAVAVFAGANILKRQRFQSYLAAVGLPAQDGYMGGLYPRWEPIKFTYKKYKDKPGMDSPEFKEISLKKFIHGGCPPAPLFTGGEDMSADAMDELAETDPDAMYFRYFFEKAGGDNETAMRYLKKAAQRGHVLANIDLTDYMGNDERQRVLDVYAKITPYAEEKRKIEIRLSGNIPRIIAIAKNANQYPYILMSLYVDHDPYPYPWDHISALPQYKDHWCEAYYRGCLIGSLPETVTCSQ